MIHQSVEQDHSMISIKDAMWPFVNRQEEIYVEQPKGFVEKGGNVKLVEEFKREMKQVFEMIDLGLMTYFLGMEIKQAKDEEFSDTDWGRSFDDMKNTSRYRFSLGSGIFLWCSKKQEIVAQSTVDAEFIAATAAVNQALWLRKILCDLHLKQWNNTKVLVDNQAAIAISHNPVFHGKTKHFKIKLFFLRDVQKEGEIALIYCKSENQLADIFIKPLLVSKFEALREKLGVCST
ncbi:Copia protein [Vitis vinifera]|uniref:Copia protein n=1 Tax=Vitis vinifera TaxID=29760 RepID=A0A438FGJ1_VITVI|nr:Copia protein [Vitis vinifera]